jgi:hypothetical protein
MASDCADWMKPFTRSVYFSIFIRRPSACDSAPQGTKISIFNGFVQPALTSINARRQIHRRSAGLTQMWEPAAARERGAPENSAEDKGLRRRQPPETLRHQLVGMT